MVNQKQLIGDGFIFIPGNIPSLKNSKVKTKGGIFSSKTVTKFIRSLGIQSYSVSKKQVKGYVARPNKFLELIEPFKEQIKNEKKPYLIGFHFVRNSHRRFDFVNIVQIIADLLVAHDIIEDDDMTCFIPIPIKIDDRYFTIDKENPGVYIKIL